MPLKNKNKSQLVQEYLALGFSEDELLYQSFSCYEGTDKPCGICRSCLRKFIALTNNYIECDNIFKEWPGNHLQLHLQESISKDRKSEIEEIKKCMSLTHQY